MPMITTDDGVALHVDIGIPHAHVVGLSMGGFTALHLAMRHPGRVAAAVVAGAGYGTQPERQERSARNAALSRRPGETP